MADLENGLFAGWENNQDQNISTNTPLKNNFVTAVLVGDVASQNGGKGRFALYGSDATTGNLNTLYDGIRPAKTGYVPMHKQGSIILGIGGGIGHVLAEERTFPVGVDILCEGLFLGEKLLPQFKQMLMVAGPLRLNPGFALDAEDVLCGCQAVSADDRRKEFLRVADARGIRAECAQPRHL